MNRMLLVLRCGCTVSFEYAGESFFTVDCPIGHGPQRIVRAFG